MTKGKAGRELPMAAGGGLVDRRALLGSLVLGGGAGLATSGALAQAGAPATEPSWMLETGGPFTAYGVPAQSQAGVQRLLSKVEGFDRAGSSRTPLEQLEGTITPNGLHFERHHNGVPGIDPAQHKLYVHGRVKRQLAFSYDALLRYPMVSRMAFVECGGNSGGNSRGTEAPKLTAGGIHGLLSAAQWTGVPLAVLLDEAGVEPDAAWVVAEGADAAAMDRSIPLAKCMDDAMVALFQNGEAIRPEQGFPMRLLLPGFEGNTNVKWLRRLKVQPKPAETRNETSKYTHLMPDGRARQFNLRLPVKSVILKPSPGFSLQGPGLYQISGLAWTGAGSITKVEVSADGGKSWAEASLDGPAVPMALNRFRLPWQWNGAPCVLMSRATDQTGAVQPTRKEHLAKFAPGQGYHYNAMQTWSVDAAGEVTNVFV
jgi:sulfane dehydrogenase subunit SoxC